MDIGKAERETPFVFRNMGPVSVIESIGIKEVKQARSILEVPLLVDGEEIRTENVEYFPTLKKSSRTGKRRDRSFLN